MRTPLFPHWIDRSRPLLAAGAAFAAVYIVGMLYYATPALTSSKGYSPEQPVPFSHALHVGELAMDCRYCHTTVEKAAFAAVPPTATCINCHARIAPDSNKMIAVQQSAASGEKPIPWVKIHDLPDYVYFNHSAHVTRGVSCVSCHGRIDQMEQVYQAKSLTMAWCLECHRNPDPHLRPPELVTDLDWEPSDEAEHAAFVERFKRERNINPSTDCSTCHR
jgi:hypothetical protein